MSEAGVSREELKALHEATVLVRKTYSAHALRDKLPNGMPGGKTHLKTSGAQILVALALDDGRSVTELAQELHVSHAAVSFAMTRLEQARYVRSETSPEDGRITLYWITEDGMGCLARILS